jgi:small subunit ribosomal protein S20
MPNIKSAEKRVKTCGRKKEENIKVRGAMRKATKKATEAKETINNAFKAIDKALKKGIIKKNTAARKKSRLAKKVNKAE